MPDHLGRAVPHILLSVPRLDHPKQGFRCLTAFSLSDWKEPFDRWPIEYLKSRGGVHARPDILRPGLCKTFRFDRRRRQTMVYRPCVGRRFDAVGDRNLFAQLRHSFISFEPSTTQKTPQPESGKAMHVASPTNTRRTGSSKPKVKTHRPVPLCPNPINGIALSIRDSATVLIRPCKRHNSLCV